MLERQGWGKALEEERIVLSAMRKWILMIIMMLELMLLSRESVKNAKEKMRSRVM